MTPQLYLQFPKKIKETNWKNQMLRRHIIKMVLQHSWLKQIKKHTCKAGNHVQIIKANMCFLFAHCQGTAKHKLTFGNLRFFSKRNCSSKNQENNIASEGAGTQFAMGKLSLLYFTNLNHTWRQFLKASLNCWTTFWADVTVSDASCTQNGEGSHWRIEFASLRLAIIKMFYS